MNIRHIIIKTYDNKYEYFLEKEEFNYEFREETNGKVTHKEYRSSNAEAIELFDEYILAVKGALVSMEVNFKQTD
jgi:hypothetical protein